jgi:hypothetical protein
MTAVWGLLTSRLAGPIATGAAVLLVLALGWARFQLADARANLADEVADHAATTRGLDRCIDSRTALEVAIKDQNDKIAALAQESAAATAAANAALVRERAKVDAASEAATALLNRVVPQGVGACEAAMGLLREGAP